MKARQQMLFDGKTLYRYDSVVTRDAIPVNTTHFVDWFASDEEATQGLTDILKRQGYQVKQITLGFPCVAEIL